MACSDLTKGCTWIAGFDGSREGDIKALPQAVGLAGIGQDVLVRQDDRRQVRTACHWSATIYMLNLFAPGAMTRSTPGRSAVLR